MMYERPKMDIIELQLETVILTSLNTEGSNWNNENSYDDNGDEWQ